MLLQSAKLSGISALLAAGVLGAVVLAQQGNGPGHDAGAQPVKNSAAKAREKPQPRLNANKELYAAYRALDLEAKTQLIRRKLDQVIDAEFPNGTTLEGVLKHISKPRPMRRSPGSRFTLTPMD